MRRARRRCTGASRAAWRAGTTPIRSSCRITSPVPGLPTAALTDLAAVYRNYIACLNEQDWPTLENYVHEDVSHNGRQIGIAGYREMLEQDFWTSRTFTSAFSC